MKKQTIEITSERIDDIPTEVASVDTSSFSVNHQQTESESESLLRYGHSKDKAQLEPSRWSELRFI